jgi:hypothetical protein
MKSKEFYRREPLVVWLECDESTVTFYGHDLGGNPNAKEYEYWLTVASEDLRQALDGTDRDRDIGALVCAHAEEIVSLGEMSWLREHGVKYKFHSWIGFPLVKDVLDLLLDHAHRLVVVHPSAGGRDRLVCGTNP